MIVLAFDPGGTTGFMVWSSGGVKAHGEAKRDVFLAWAEVVISMYQPWELEVVGEKFTIGPATLKGPADAARTIEAIGCVKWWCRTSSVPYTEQQPATAKGMVSDHALRSLGWHLPSAGGHANDAARHLAAFLVLRGVLSPSEMRTEVLGRGNQPARRRRGPQGTRQK
jgi:hypothetical protein